MLACSNVHVFGGFSILVTHLIRILGFPNVPLAGFEFSVDVHG